MLPASLLESVERLYRVFERYTLPSPGDYSPHSGISVADEGMIRRQPLRLLDVQDLERYARAALTTWGSVVQFKHFLPRLFELFVVRPGSIGGLLFEKLSAAEWRTWPPEEQAAVDSYLLELWQWVLTVGPDVIDALDVLRGIGLASHDLHAWLDAWRRDSGVMSTRQLAHLVFREQDDLLRGELSSSWHPRDRVLVAAYLREPHIRERIETAYLEHPGGAAGRELAAAADILAVMSR